MVDSNGKPINAHVQVELIAHECDFGANLFGFHKIKENDPAKAIDTVCNTVIVFN